MVSKAVSLVAGLALLTGIAGCKIHVEKGANGEDKNVRVDTPFGGVHVNTGQTTAADLGLPVYPGAAVVQDNDEHKSADVKMGFGEWQLRVLAVTYTTPDSRDKVSAFYKKALGRYGDVITCQGDTPVGTPTVTSQGLSCVDDGKHSTVHIDDSKNGFDLRNGLQLKAGSKRHQHIVGFEDSKDNKTMFALVSVSIPAGMDGSGGKSD